MDDITRILEERKRQLPEVPNDEPAVGLPTDADGQETDRNALPTASEMVLVAAIDRQQAAGEQPRRDQILEALLFAAPSPVSETRLREILNCTGEELTEAVFSLNQHYEQTQRSFRIHRIAMGYQLYTLPEYAEWIRKLFKSSRTLRLSRASLETLAIIAYKQPITKPEIEQLRGVDATAPLATLLQRRLIVLAGRAHKPGNPFLYRTSREFLRYFGLATLDDLPRPDEIAAFLRQREGDAESDIDGLVIAAESEQPEQSVATQYCPDGSADGQDPPAPAG